MGEIKSVKVDNWGVFFLQKLQNFFNKTDYCDLTLQFRDNSQLKVHRLVLSACTDYFNVLEQTCDVIDDALLMPDELQADVVVPIVNFMYTGTLEFELKMYDKLLRTAKEMNMTVLLKLLEAHRRTMEGVNRTQRPPSPKTIRRGRAPGTTNSGVFVSQQQQQQQQRRILATANVSQQNRVQQTNKNIATNAQQHQQQQQQQQQLSIQAYKQQIAATSLLRATGGTIKTQYGTTTIYSTNQSAANKSAVQQQAQTSPFEQLRKGYNNNKRPAPTTFVSPPAKKPNIEDVKEFAEQQRMRKQIAAEYGDDADYEGMLMDDDIHNDDDDEDVGLNASGGGGGTTASAVASTSKNVTPTTTSPQAATTITFRQDSADKPPTIVVKDSSNSKMNHAKIISEVLRQYPHLVKGNKNIKLKIMPSTGSGQTQKIIVKKEPLDSQELVSTPPRSIPASSQSGKVAATSSEQQIAPTKVQQAVQTVNNSSNNTNSNNSNNNNNGTGTGGTQQKRRIDSKTMHTLIAQGAENITGPWLCLRCGVNGRPISIPSYRGFRRHLINTHKETIDPALCEHCGWRSASNRELHFHSQVEHKVRTTLYTFPECLMCADLFLDTNALNQHMLENHTDENKQQCIYCNKIFAKELQLYTHMKTYHKKQALMDGIIDYSDDELTSANSHLLDDIDQKQASTTKVKILSNISLPSSTRPLKLEPSSEAAALSTVASGIATSIGISADAHDDGSEYALPSSADNTIEAGEHHNEDDEPKFVNADGNEMVLTAEQRKEIMSQLNEGGAATSGGVVMVLNEAALEASEMVGDAGEENVGEEDDSEAHRGTAAQASADDEEEEEDVEEEHEEHDSEAGAETEEHEEEFDDSQIYKELTGDDHNTARKENKDASSAIEKKTAVASAKKQQQSSSVREESKESIEENLEWAENLISAHDLADTEGSADTGAGKRTEGKKTDDISKKLKELTGDWSDEEEEDDGEEEEDDEDGNDDGVEHDDDETREIASKKLSGSDKKTAKKNVQEEEETKSQSSMDKQNDQDQTEKETSNNDLVNAGANNVMNMEEHDEIDSSKEEQLDNSTSDELDAAMKSLHKEEDVAENKHQDEIGATDEPMETEPIKTAKGKLAAAHDEHEMETETVVDDSKEQEENKCEELSVQKTDNKIKSEKSLVEEGMESAVAKALLDELAAEADLVPDDAEEFISDKSHEELSQMSSIAGGDVDHTAPLSRAVEKDIASDEVKLDESGETTTTTTSAVAIIETENIAESSLATTTTTATAITNEGNKESEVDAIMREAVEDAAIGDDDDDDANGDGDDEANQDVDDDEEDRVPNVPTTTTLAEALAATGTTLDDDNNDVTTTVAITDTTTTTLTTSSATAAKLGGGGEDKVKSLISEWGDDEDDEDGDEDL